jgi:hypothetical protein
LRTETAGQALAEKASRVREMQEQMKLVAEAQKSQARAERALRQQRAEVAEQEAAAAAASKRKHIQGTAAAAAAAGTSDDGGAIVTPPSSPEPGPCTRAQEQVAAQQKQQERLTLKFLVCDFVWVGDWPFGIMRATVAAGCRN